jgi:hypothetical protein
MSEPDSQERPDELSDEHDEEWHREHDIVAAVLIELPPLGEFSG